MQRLSLTDRDSRTWLHGTSEYLEAIEVLFRDTGFADPKFEENPQKAPVLVLLAYAFEQLIKVAIQNSQGSFLKSHELDKLWNEISSVLQPVVDAATNKFKAANPYWQTGGFAMELKKLSDWTASAMNFNARYPSEAIGPLVQTKYLHFVALAILEHIK